MAKYHFCSFLFLVVFLCGCTESDDCGPLDSKSSYRYTDTLITPYTGDSVVIVFQNVQPRSQRQDVPYRTVVSAQHSNSILLYLYTTGKIYELSRPYKDIWQRGDSVFAWLFLHGMDFVRVRAVQTVRAE